jgi:hypothetical protein
MKSLASTLLLVLISISSISQNKIESEVISILNKYRIESGVDKSHSYTQSHKVTKLTNNSSILIFGVSPTGDTTYHDIVIGGDTKHVPKYHDKNTVLLIADSLTTKDYNGVVVLDNELPSNWKCNKNFDPHSYMDSLFIQKLFNSIIISDDYSGILLSSRNFYIDCSAHINDSYETNYYIKIYEILDTKGLNIPSDYGSEIIHENTSYLKPMMVDRKTKKVLYPDLAKKIKRKNS